MSKTAVYTCIIFSTISYTTVAYCKCPCQKKKVSLAQSQIVSKENRDYFAPIKIGHMQNNNTQKNIDTNLKTSTIKNKIHNVKITEIRKHRRMSKFGF